MTTNPKQPARQRAELARALDAAFVGCDQWTVVTPRRRSTKAASPARSPIAFAEAERATLDASVPEVGALRA